MDKKIKNGFISLKFIFKPLYWFLSYKYSREWDEKLSQLIEDNYCFEEITHYTAKINGITVWVSNHPYASFYIYNPEIRVRPSRLTIERAHRHLIKSIIKNNESKSRN